MPMTFYLFTFILLNKLLTTLKKHTHCSITTHRCDPSGPPTCALTVGAWTAVQGLPWDVPPVADPGHPRALCQSLAVWSSQIDSAPREEVGNYIRHVCRSGAFLENGRGGSSNPSSHVQSAREKKKKKKKKVCPRPKTSMCVRACVRVSHCIVT